MAESVAIVGTGLVGRAWAIAFARAGWTVRLWDPLAVAPGAALAAIDGLLADLAAQDLLDGADASTVRARLRAAPTLADALAGVSWVQESAPEDLATKQALWRELDAAADPATILASSTSAIVPSLFTEALAGRGRCLVCHPLNPPYLIPAIELVPAPWTTPEATARAEAVMRGIGQSPIVMRRELDGFVMNRLQGALLEEAFRLVADGYCSTEDVDRGLKDGLALRWSFMGPFETIELNAPGGIPDYCARYTGFYKRLQDAPATPQSYGEANVAQIVREWNQAATPERIARRMQWRDERLAALAAHKKTQPQS